MPPDSADQDRARLIVVEARSYGIQVFEQPGCYTARDRWLRVPQYIVDHHDASTIASGEWGSLGYILRERISNFQVARCLDNVPKLALIAAGANCPHAGVGGPWGACPRDSMNGWGYGVEKAATTGERYTPAALYATQGLYRAIEVVCGRPPGSMVVEHAEWGNLGHTNRKNDSDYGKGGTPNGGPGGNGNWMRQQVRDFRPNTTKEEDDMTPDQARQLDQIWNMAQQNAHGVAGGWGAGANLLAELAFRQQVLATLQDPAEPVDVDVLAASLAPLLVPAVTTAVGQAGGLTPEQVKDITEKAMRDVLGSLAEPV